MKEHRKRKKAFTSVELLIVIALVAIIGLSSIPFLSRFFVQSLTNDTYSRLLADLRQAQTNAIAGKQNGSWGVYYGMVGGSRKIILYQGSSYATHTNALYDQIYAVNSNVTITGLTDINFAQLTGKPSSSATIIITGTSNTTRTIQINTQGIINYAMAGPTYTPGAPTVTPTPTYTPPSGPPVVDATSGAPKSVCTTNCSWSQTIGNSPNRLLVVGVGSATVPTSVTYGGVALSLIDEDCGADCSSLWYLAAPAVGTNTVAVSGGGVVGAGSISFRNVNQQTPFASHQESTQTGTSVTMNVPGTTTNMVVVDDDFHLATGSVTPGSGQTVSYDSGSSFTNVIGSHKAGTTTITNMSWTGNTGNWYETAVAIN